MTNQLLEFQSLLKKVEMLKKSGEVDLSAEEDLALAIMNLISLEEHFFFTGIKTGKTGYFDSLQEVRTMRKELMARMIDRNEGETWCAVKHLLAATMRLMEVGTKFQSAGKKAEAKEMFDQAGQLFSIFWGLRLKLLTLPAIKQAENGKRPWTLKDIVDKLVDCCDEK